MSEESETPDEEQETDKNESADAGDTGGDTDASATETSTDENYDAQSTDESDTQDSDEQAAEPQDDVNTSAADGSGITPYDFNHPQHRLGDPTPQFNLCGKKIASEVSAVLDTELHVEATVALAGTRYCKQKELVTGFDASVSIFRSDISPLSLNLYVVLQHELILSLVAHFFGGATLEAQESATRALSQTERRFALRLRATIINALVGTCKDCFSVSNNEEMIISSEELITATVEDTVVAVQDFTVSGKNSEQNFSIVYPWSAVESLSSISVDDSIDTAAQSRVWNHKLQEHLAACAVELQGKLAETEVTVSQLLDMQPGDFIPLGDVGAATFMVDNTPIFDASIGASNGFVSASILHWSLDGDSRHG